MMSPTSTALMHCRESGTYDELPGRHEALCQPQALANSHLQAARSKPALSVVWEFICIAKGFLRKVIGMSAHDLKAEPLGSNVTESSASRQQSFCDPV